MLRQWVRKFFRAYAAHATVIRILSQADLVPEEVFGDGLQLFFSIAESMTTGMTASAQAAGRTQEHAELTAVACLMMLERVNYLISAEVPLPETEMADRIADIMFAAFGLTVSWSRRLLYGGHGMSSRSWDLLLGDARGYREARS